ncbi:hypothetical protein [Actinoallomurus acanthiterrae]
MRPPAWFRLMRAGAFAAVCVVLSVAAHGLMDPRPVPAYAGWGAFAALTGIGYCLADRRRSVWWILLAVEVVQAGVHLWFSAFSAPAVSAAGGNPVRVAHSMPGMPHMVIGTVQPSTPHMGVPGWGMFVAHAAAGALVAVWLSAGERAAWRALSVMTRILLAPALRLFALLMGLVIVERSSAEEIDRRSDHGRRPRIGALRHTVVRRGPPMIGSATVPVLL